MGKENDTVTKTSQDEKSKKNDSFVINIPRLRFKQDSLNGYLIFSLVIFAFLLGMLTNKVLFLEKQVKDASKTASVPTTANQAAPTAVPPPQIVKVDNGKLPILGNENAKVTIVEFMDLQCPFCKQYFDQTANQIYDTYIKTGKAKLYFRHYPLYSIHPNAEKAAEAVECANEQNKFWDYQDKIFAMQPTWSPLAAEAVITAFVDYAGQLGLDTNQFKTCLDTSKYKQTVADDAAAGNKVQVDGTPAFFVNGYRLIGAQPFSEFQRVIDEQLNK
jgi:protein-disulfide isomerase